MSDFQQPVMLGDAEAPLRAGLQKRLEHPTVPRVSEKAFLPENVIPLEQQARDERKIRKLLQNPTRVLVKGGARVVKLKINVPMDQYAGLQRFEGRTDGEKINMILRMANRRIDELAAQGPEAMRKAQETVTDET